MAEDDVPDLRLEIPDDQDFSIIGTVGLAKRHTEMGVDLIAEGLRIANWWLKARRLREDTFASGLFADPAWDILLDLYTADERGECVQISSLALAARVPHSTAIRWAKIMTSKGLIDRHKDPRDARRIHVRLSASARALMEEYLARLCRSGHVPWPVLAHPAK